MTNRRQSDINHDVEYARAQSRTFYRDGEWYFSSREGDFGPFGSEAEANREMESYVQLIDLRPENEGPVTPDYPEDDELESHDLADFYSRG